MHTTFPHFRFFISENTGKFVLRDLATLTNSTYCTSQHGALVNRFPVMMTPFGWREFPTIFWFEGSLHIFIIGLSFIERPLLDYLSESQRVANKEIRLILDEFRADSWKSGVFWEVPEYTPHHSQELWLIFNCSSPNPADFGRISPKSETKDLLQGTAHFPLKYPSSGQLLMVILCVII